MYRTGVRRGKLRPRGQTGPVTVSINGAVGGETPYFWGTFIDGTKASSQEAQLLNATPIRSLRFGANQIDQENWSNGCLYTPGTSGPSCGSLQETPQSFATLCRWIPADFCLLGLPAEINSASTDAFLMHWLASNDWRLVAQLLGGRERTRGLGRMERRREQQPIRGRAGRPPTRMRGRPRGRYGLAVENVTNTVRHLDPGACVMGIESNSNAGHIASWFGATLADEPNVTEVAYHSYPNNQCTGTLASLLSTASETQMADCLRAGRCAGGRGGRPVNAGARGRVQHRPQRVQRIRRSSTAAAFTSANVAQALADLIPTFTFFEFFCSNPACMFQSGTDGPTDVYYLYSDLFTHVDLTTVYNVTFAGATVGTYMVGGAANDSDRSLLISNAGLSWENVSLSGVVPASWNVALYSLDNNSAPTEASSVGPGTIEIPVQSTVVVHYWNASAIAQTYGPYPNPDPTVQIATPGSIFSGLAATTTVLPAALLIGSVLVILAVVLVPRKDEIHRGRR